MPDSSGQRPPRVPILNPKTATGLSKLTIEAAEKMRGGEGRMPNSVLVGANAPMQQMMLAPFISVVAREKGGGQLSTRIKEMAVIKVSQLNGCAY